jgi:uncharacterized membrane protein
MAPGSTVGRGLGAFSMALGALQLLAPHRMLDIVGVRADGSARRAMRLIGVRELAMGAGLLGSRARAPFAWGRVAGDAMDLALLAGTAARRGLRRDRTTATMGVVGLVSVADLAAGVVLARRLRSGQDEPETASGGRRPVQAAVTIDLPREELYARWRRLEDLPRYMGNLKEVRQTTEQRSHWVAEAPTGTVSWDAEITDDRPGERIAWRALPGSAVRHEGSITFADAAGGRGTEVVAELAWEPPLGPIGSVAALVTGEHPAKQLGDDLHRFKQVMETGVVAVAKADQPGTVASPARPANEQQVAR